MGLGAPAGLLVRSVRQLCGSSKPMPHRALRIPGLLARAGAFCGELRLRGRAARVFQRRSGLALPQRYDSAARLEGEADHGAEVLLFDGHLGVGVEQAQLLVDGAQYGADVVGGESVRGGPWRRRTWRGSGRSRMSQPGPALRTSNLRGIGPHDTAAGQVAPPPADSPSAALLQRLSGPRWSGLRAQRFRPPARWIPWAAVRPADLRSALPPVLGGRRSARRWTRGSPRCKAGGPRQAQLSPQEVPFSTWGWLRGTAGVAGGSGG